jgi:hypothetical protein
MTPQQNMITDSFNSQVYSPNTMDVQNTPLYDTVTIPATTGGITGQLNVSTSALFSNVGPQSGKTLALTNLTQAQKLAAPEAFSIFGFRFRTSENLSILDIYNIYNGFCLEFYLGQKVYQRGPLWYYGAGGGIAGFFTLSQTSVFTNGVAGRSDMHKLGISVVIENQMTFYAQLNGTQYTLLANGTGITYQLVLDGLYARGVQ